MSRTTILAAVSFRDTPLTLIGEKAGEILAAGWTQYATLGDDWVAKFEKIVPDALDAGNAEHELRSIMGEYWRDVDEAAQGEEPDQEPAAP